MGETGAPTGHMNLTAAATFGRSVLAPVISDFLEAHPGVSVSARFLDRVVDLIEEDIDIAVLPDSSLVARRVGAVRRMMVASPDYLAAHGAPDAPAALRDHAVIAFTGLMPNREWRHRARGRVRTVAVEPRFEVNDALSVLAAAEAGKGVCPALSYMVGDELAAGRLMPVLEDFSPAPVPVHLVHQQGRLVPPKVRAFMDFAAPRLAAALGDLSPEGG